MTANAAFLLCRSIRCQSCNEQFDTEISEAAATELTSVLCPFCRVPVALSATPFDIYRRAFMDSLHELSDAYRHGVLDSLFHLFGLTNFEVRYPYGSAESVDYKAGIDKGRELFAAAFTDKKIRSCSHGSGQH